VIVPALEGHDIPARRAWAKVTSSAAAEGARWGSRSGSRAAA
jgi:hypothetical protein